MQTRCRSSGLLALLAAVSCQPPAAPPPSVTVSVEGGIPVAFYPEGWQESVDSWSVDSLRTIGEGKGEGGELFGRVVSAVLVPDGVLLSDATFNDLRILSLEGDLLARWGREGEGPGEFRRLRWVQEADDGAFHAWDQGLQRLTVFAGPDSILRTASGGALGNPGLSFVLGGFGDGSLLVNTVDLAAPGPPQSGVIGGMSPLARAEPETGVMRTLAEVPSKRFYVGEGGRRIAVPLSVDPAYDARGRFLAAGNGADHELSLWTVDGARQFVVRFEPGDEVTEADREAWREAFRESETGAAPGVAEALMRDVPFPRHHPSFDWLMVTRAGVTWVRTERAGRGVREWLALDPRGMPLGRILLEENVRLTDGDDRLLVGVVRDELDVERIRLTWYGG
jgi:hypothetical protein